MDVFIIHRFSARRAALRLVKTIAKDRRIDLCPFVLDSSGGEAWKSAAHQTIERCEAVIAYDLPSCLQSENAAWELKKAEEIGRPVIVLDPPNPNIDEVAKLVAVYHDDEEFESYFDPDGSHTELLYKMMVNSSEQLIERRQRMNAFFVTAIGALLAIAGAIAKFGPIDSPTITFVLTASFGVAALLMCNSWRNLIVNYGKLNAGKFRVILKLERSLSAQVYSAEWAALGKGRRRDKYRSFTSTESNVPLWFAGLIVGLVLFASVLYVIGQVSPTDVAPVLETAAF